MAGVFIPIPIKVVEEAGEAPSLTYRLDFERGRIQGKTDGLAAVNQAIKKAILTPRFKCLIYDNQYGSEIQQAVIADDITEEYAMAAIPGFIEDALKPDGRILQVSDFEFRFEEEKLYIFFRADTIFGQTTVEGVI